MLTTSVHADLKTIACFVLDVRPDLVLVFACRCFARAHHKDTVVDVVVVLVLLAVVVLRDVAPYSAIRSRPTVPIHTAWCLRLERQG